MTMTPAFSHVVFMMRCFEEMKAWYINVLGAEIVHGDPTLAFLTYDDESHRFAITRSRCTRHGLNCARRKC
ncbi:MAG: hypothetical protein HKN81_07915 [Gammaproteobacteria bacterium]|nr:hypothetical protein [Gammaproteobacteria bacterium]NND37046.1 hypothetical protein [Gammaproteobacteria bacterium]